VCEDLAQRELPAIKMSGCRIRGADFSAASMAQADLSGCNLARQIAGDDFSNAALVKSNLDYADLAAASLVGINLG
jgi:uncharacterized protein YjbI with pentapeptide repeats